MTKDPKPLRGHERVSEGSFVSGGVEGDSEPKRSPGASTEGAPTRQADLTSLRAPMTDVNLVGMGPSALDTPWWARPTFCINESVLLFPSRLGFVWDMECMGRIDRALRQRFGSEWEEMAPRLCVHKNIWTHNDYAWVRKHGTYWEPASMRGEGITAGTASVALVVLSLAGCQRVHLWGFDRFWEVLGSVEGQSVDAFSAMDGEAGIFGVDHPWWQARTKADPPQRYGTVALNMTQVAQRRGLVLVRGGVVA